MWASAKWPSYLLLWSITVFGCSDPLEDVPPGDGHSIEEHDRLVEQFMDKIGLSNPGDVLAPREEFLAELTKSCGRARGKGTPFARALADPTELPEEIHALIDTSSPDELAWYAIEAISGDLDVRLTYPMMLYLFDVAADRGSSIAANEIGHALLHCRFGLRQDIPSSVSFLEQAIDSKDTNAFLNLFHILHYELAEPGLTDQRPSDLLIRCVSLGNETCRRYMNELNEPD